MGIGNETSVYNSRVINQKISLENFPDRNFYSSQHCTFRNDVTLYEEMSILEVCIYVSTKRFIIFHGLLWENFKTYIKVVLAKHNISTLT